MNPEDVRNLRRNYFVNVMDGALFGMGLGFTSFSTVIPLFVSTMTDSAILIGLITAVHVTGWQVPQLLTAQSISRMARYKPMVIWMTIQERVPFLGLAIIALFYRQLGPVPALILTFIMLLWQGIGAGLTANPWQNMIAKLIPSSALATFFGVQSSASNLLASGAAVIAGLVLERQPFPYNYITCFLLTSAAMVFSFFFIAATRESPHLVLTLQETASHTWHNMLDILRRDRNFDWFLLARMAVQMGTMAFSFYTVFAVERLAASSYIVGVLTSVLMVTQVASNLLLGWLADRWNRKSVLVIGAVAITLSALIARFAPSIEWMVPVMILAAFANTTSWTVTMAITLEFGTQRERPTYVGMANTLIAPASILAPVLGGWLADSQGYPATFLLSATAGILAAGILFFLVKEPSRR